MRGGLHFCCLRAEGLGVAEAGLADPAAGPDRLRALGRRPDDLAALQARASRTADAGERWRRAEERTDAAVAELLAVLPDADLDRLLDLASRVGAVAAARR